MKIDKQNGSIAFNEEAHRYWNVNDEYKVKERYEDNKCRFIASIDNHYQFYTFMYLLQREIYFNSKRKI